MIKSELVQFIADRNPHLFQRDVENIVNSVFEEISNALSDGNRVELRGFGAFSVKNRPARAGRNPENRRASRRSMKNGCRFSRLAKSCGTG